MCPSKFNIDEYSKIVELELKAPIDASVVKTFCNKSLKFTSKFLKTAQIKFFFYCFISFARIE